MKYYERKPPQHHYTGDLWSGIPTYGLLNVAKTNAVVITPACDLSNRKVETVVMLPIQSLRDYLCSPTSLRLTSGILKQAGRAVLPGFELWPSVKTLPDDFWLRGIEEQLSRGLKASESAINRIRSGISVLLGLRDSGTATYSDVERLYGKDLERHLDQIIRNHPEKPDTYFLPPDRIAEPPCIQRPSVVLLRYPLTFPVALLDLANERKNLPDWDRVLSHEFPSFLMGAHFRDERPLKFARLERLVSLDLVSRYSALALRVGLPDLASAKIARIKSEI